MWLWSFFLKELSVSGPLITETGSKGERSFHRTRSVWKNFERCGSDDKESASQCRRPGLDPSVRKIPWRSGYPLQYPWLETSMDRGVQWATVRGVTKSLTRLSEGLFFFFLILYSFSPHLLPLAGTFMPFWCHPGSFSCFLLLAMHARVRPWALSLGLDPVVRLLLLLYLTFTLFCSQSAHLLPVSWNIHDFLIFVCVCRLSVWSKLSNSLGKYLGAHW